MKFTDLSLRQRLLIVLVFYSIVALLILVPPPTSAQPADGCLPVGDRPADVRVCDATLDGSEVVLDLEADTQTTVHVALAAGSETEGSVSTVERTVSGNTTLRFPSPSQRSVRWSVATLEGFAFGEAGRTVDIIEKDPTWSELFAVFTAGILGVVLNVVVAVFIVLRGRETFIRQLW
jgi:hypothetical protein